MLGSYFLNLSAASLKADFIESHADSTRSLLSSHVSSLASAISASLVLPSSILPSSASICLFNSICASALAPEVFA